MNKKNIVLFFMMKSDGRRKKMKNISVLNKKEEEEYEKIKTTKALSILIHYRIVNQPNYSTLA
jgi:hypothetical protein